MKALEVFFQIYKKLPEDKFKPYYKKFRTKANYDIIKKEIADLKEGGIGGTYK